MNTPDHPILSALMIYAVEHGPLRLTQEQVVKFDGQHHGALQLRQDAATGDWLIFAERVSPQLADAISQKQGGQHAMQSSDSFFGPSTLYGPLQNQRREPEKRDTKVIQVATITLNGGPHDGERVIVPLPLKRVIFRAGPGDKKMHPEVAYSVKGQAYGRREDDPRRKGGMQTAAYDYLGFVSMEDLNNQICEHGGEAYDESDWWRHGGEPE